MTLVTRNRNHHLEKPKRTVKKQNRLPKHMDVIAISLGQAVTEQGEVMTVPTLIEQLPDLPPTLFAKRSAGDFIATLDEIFSVSHPDTWQWRATSHERDIITINGYQIPGRVTTAVHYFGWRTGGSKSGAGRFHRIIDPVTMHGKQLDEIWPGPEPQLNRLLAWAEAIRDFCTRNRLNVRPTLGGISSQFLTDPRFYPQNRRKVPHKINERVREYLPGNHYHLQVQPSTREFTAHYLDQKRAHHYHALTTPLPCANTLFAYGDFLNLERVCFRRPWDDFYGVYYMDLEPPKHVAFPWIKQHSTFVYSNEVQHLLDSGYKIAGIRAAWGSNHRDIGVPKYAAWAMQQLDEYSDPPWLKQLLLCTYGVLATKPSFGESVFRMASKGEDVFLRTGKKRLTGKLTKRTKRLEPNIANVLHRGMIEAATRSESVGLAQWLEQRGQRILSIYADAVMVEADDDKPLPLLPEPWRQKQTLNHLQFINQQAFMSGELTKLPGVSRELLKHRQHSNRAPKRVLYDALTGRPLTTDRRI